MAIGTYASPRIRRLPIRKEFSGCWRFSSIKPDNTGYVRLEFRRSAGKRKRILAHRFMYELVFGELPKQDLRRGRRNSAVVLDHICRNRACINPSHLRKTTFRDNVLVGNGACARNARKTHCPKGHRLEKNTNGNHRRCLICKRAWRP